MRVTRFVIIWAVPLVVIPLVVLAWCRYGPPPLGSALFLVVLCVGSPLLNRTIWRVR